MAQSSEAIRNLSGPQKAAVFMLALDQENAAQLFEMMDDEEIRELSQTMANVGTIQSTTVEQLFLEFADQLSGSGSLVGSFDSTERLLRNALDSERVGNIMSDIRGPAGRTMWDKLGSVNEAVLANYLKNEYPQTVAVILSKVKSDHASRVLALLPENMAMEVVTRMLRMETVQKEVLDHVERTLRSELMTKSCADGAPGLARADGGHLQQPGPQHREPFHGRAGGAQPRSGGPDQAADVHV